MASIPDAPWILETEATGHCSASNGAWWNNPPEYYDEYEEEDDFGGEDDFYGNETSGF